MYAYGPGLCASEFDYCVCRDSSTSPPRSSLYHSPTRTPDPRGINPCCISALCIRTSSPTSYRKQSSLVSCLLSLLYLLRESFPAFPAHSLYDLPQMQRKSSLLRRHCSRIRSPAATECSRLDNRRAGGAHSVHVAKRFDLALDFSIPRCLVGFKEIRSSELAHPWAHGDHSGLCGCLDACGSIHRGDASLDATGRERRLSAWNVEDAPRNTHLAALFVTTDNGGRMDSTGTCSCLAWIGLLTTM